MIGAQEFKKLEKITKNRFLKWQPNRCITVYKNRGGEYTKCKIWVDCLVSSPLAAVLANAS